MNIFGFLKSVSITWYFNENLVFTKFNIQIENCKHDSILWCTHFHDRDQNYQNKQSSKYFKSVKTFIYSLMKCQNFKELSSYDINRIRPNQSMRVAQISSNTKDSLSSQGTKRVKQPKSPNPLSWKTIQRTSNGASKGMETKPIKWDKNK